MVYLHKQHWGKKNCFFCVFFYFSFFVLQFLHCILFAAHWVEKLLRHPGHLHHESCGSNFVAPCATVTKDLMDSNNKTKVTVRWAKKLFSPHKPFTKRTSQT